MVHRGEMHVTQFQFGDPMTLLHIGVDVNPSHFMSRANFSTKLIWREFVRTACEARHTVAALEFVIVSFVGLCVLYVSTACLSR